MSSKPNSWSASLALLGDQERRLQKNDIKYYIVDTVVFIFQLPPACLYFQNSPWLITTNGPSENSGFNNSGSGYGSKIQQNQSNNLPPVYSDNSNQSWRSENQDYFDPNSTGKNRRTNCGPSVEQLQWGRRSPFKSR